MRSRSSKYAQQFFVPKNPSKYIGRDVNAIFYRSSWEHTVMRLFDEHPYVIAWASESIQIKYLHPFRNEVTNYIPDFLVVYADRHGRKHAELIEVKPLKQRPDYRPKAGERISKKDKEAQIVNMAKWAAATKYCAKHGLYFRWASEDELFAWDRSKKSTKKR